MKRLFILISLAILLATAVLFSPNNTAISVADTCAPSNEVTSSISKASNSSASATNTITMTGILDE